MSQIMLSNKTFFSERSIISELKEITVEHIKNFLQLLKALCLATNLVIYTLTDILAFYTCFR